MLRLKASHLEDLRVKSSVLGFQSLSPFMAFLAGIASADADAPWTPDRSVFKT